MKLQILSDIHLEFRDYVYNIENAGADVLVLAGDIGRVRELHKFFQWMKETCMKFPNVFYIPGNHEFYGSDIDSGTERLKESLEDIPNLHYLEAWNEPIYIEEQGFIGDILWSDLSGPVRANAARMGMNDYHVIYKDVEKRKLLPSDTTQLFKIAVEGLETNLNRFGSDLVVITHHAPSFKSCIPEYIEDSLNFAFISDLDNLIEVYSPKLWIHGHLHFVCDYNLCRTRVLSNCAGYPRQKIEGFNPNLVIEI